MGAALTASAFTTIAAMIAFFAAPRGAYGLLRICALWTGAMLVAIFVWDKAVAYLFLSALVLILAPAKPVLRVVFYCATFAALPDYYDLFIPFPGLNYLINIDFAKLSALLVLGPIFVSQIAKPAPAGLRSVDRILLIFVLLASVMLFRQLPFTSVLRGFFDQFVLIYMPYIAISRTIKSQDDIDLLLKALLAGAVILVVVGLITTATDWNYYAMLGDTIRSKIYSDYRGGFLRVYGSMNPPLMALVMGMGIVCAGCLRSLRSYSAPLWIAALAAFSFVVFTTGSRGGWLGVISAVLVYFMLPKLNASLQKIAVTMAVLAAVVFVFVVLNEGVSFQSDTYGTFNYRAELLRVSVDQIVRAPIFGSATFLERPEFEAIRQGEGIIDLVNAYLQIALYNGLTGLALFVGAHVLALRAGLAEIGLLVRARASGPNLATPTLAAVLGLQIGFLVMIATTSGVSYVWNFGYMLLALTVAQVRIIRQQPKAPSAEPPRGENSSGEAPASNAAGPVNSVSKPYGARFVRRP